jgi:cellulose synthase/poly-beta-1,6-N-acetylglucosamine synthase-like glycosyltransferase
MEHPLVTIIVVSYNHSQYIKENLDSIKAQTYENIQLIVGDDASADNSAEIFKEWLNENNYPADKNFHTQNTGFAAMLNECIELAKGKYVKILAADDFLHPDSIKKCVEKLEILGEEYGMVFSNTHAIDDKSSIIEDFADYNLLGNINPSVFAEELIKGNRIAALTVLIRLKVIKETGKYDTKFIVEDYYRWLKISEKYLIGYLPEKLAYYRLHSGNISKTKLEKINLETLILQMMFDKNGVAKNRINDRTQNYYFTGEKLPANYIATYNAYPFHIKRLGLAMKYKVPVSVYKFLNNFL